MHWLPIRKQKILQASALTLLLTGQAGAIPVFHPDKDNPGDLPVDRIKAGSYGLDENKAADLTVFIESKLRILRHKTNENHIYWVPTYSVAAKNAASFFEHPDMIELETNVRKANQVPGLILYRNLQNSANSSGDADPQAAACEPDDLECLDSQAPPTGNACGALLDDCIAISANGAPRSEAEVDSDLDRRNEEFSAASDGLLKDYTEVLNDEQRNLWSASLLWAFDNAGVPVLPNPTRLQLSTYLHEQKKLHAGTFSVRLMSGFTRDEILLFNKYKEIYPEFTWEKLAGNSHVKVTLDTVTNHEVTNQDGEVVPGAVPASLLTGTAMFNGGTVKIPLADTTLNFRMTAPGFRQLKKKQGQGDVFILPIKLEQEVAFNYGVNARIRCDLKAYMSGDVSFSVRKIRNSDRFVPQDLNVPQVVDASSNRCQITGDDQRLLTAQERQTLASTEQKFLDEFAKEKNASKAMRDEMLRRLMAGAKEEVEAYLPEKLRSYWTSGITTECKKVIRRKCSARVFGTCVLRASSSHNECKSARKWFKNYYTVRLPMHQIYQTKVEDTVDLVRIYEINADRDVKETLPIGDGFCIKFKADDLVTDVSRCNDEEHVKANEDLLAEE